MQRKWKRSVSIVLAVTLLNLLLPIPAVLAREAEGPEDAYLLQGEIDPSLTEPEVDREKIVSVLGDSISTYQGVTFSYYYYYSEEYMSLDDVWWKHYANTNQMNIGYVEAIGGSRVTWNGEDDVGWLGEDKCMASEARIQALAKNGTPDTILFF